MSSELSQNRFWERYGKYQTIETQIAKAFKTTSLKTLIKNFNLEDRYDRQDEYKDTIHKIDTILRQRCTLKEVKIFYEIMEDIMDRAHMKFNDFLDKEFEEAYDFDDIKNKKIAELENRLEKTTDILFDD